MTKRAGSTITYASYNLPTVINSGSNSSTLSYGAFRNRFKQVAVSSGTTETTLYVAGLFEKVTRPSGVIEYRHYLPGGQGTAAIHTRRTSGGNSTYYWHADHLGSPELFTDSGGTALVRPSFGAYGERRDGTDWNGPPSAGDLATIGNITRRGFTGHEHLDSVELIHMNGRVYDPGAGRFLSADPIIGFGNSQGVNSYAYVWNKPLSAIDPTGLHGDDVVVRRCISCDWNGIEDFDQILEVMRDLSSLWGPPEPFNHPAGAALDVGGGSLVSQPRDAVWDGKHSGGPKVMYGVDSNESKSRVNKVPEHVAKFIEFAATGALAVEEQFGVPAEVVIAQAALETGWGQHVRGNAYFNIKGISDSGKSVTVNTHEYEGGEFVEAIGEFRAYESFEEAALDYGRFLTTNPRYEQAFEHKGDPLRFAEEVAKAGYATDPAYARNLRAILRRYVIGNVVVE